MPIKKNPRNFLEISFELAPSVHIHKREVYNMISLVGDLGGALEIFTLIIGLVVKSVSKYSFNMKFLQNFYMAKTSASSLSFMNGKKKKKPLDDSNYYRISMSYQNHFKLFLLNHPCFCCKKYMRKQPSIREQDNTNEISESPE